MSCSDRMSYVSGAEQKNNHRVFVAMIALNRPRFWKRDSQNKTIRHRQLSPTAFLKIFLKIEERPSILVKLLAEIDPAMEVQATPASDHLNLHGGLSSFFV